MGKRGRRASVPMVSIAKIYVLTFLISTGSFLIIDTLFLHAITFNYSLFGASWLDPYISHAYWGIALIASAVVLLLSPSGKSNMRGVNRRG